MQDKKITFLVFSTDYNVVQIGLFRGPAMQELVTEHKFSASKHLMSTVLNLLERYHTSWQDLSFIATNQGPGPFTTMRVIIATLNGLSFATAIPLIGVDGLKALLATPTYPQPTLALLNAFAQDVYYAYHHDNTIKTGWMPINTLLETYMAETHERHPVLIGNGVTVYKEAITHHLPHATIIDQPAPDITIIAQHALAQWHNKETHSILLPLYLKTMHYQPST